MLINYLKPFLIFIPLAAFQLAVVPLITVMNFSPNLIIVLLVFYALQFGQIYGMILGFILGGIFDLISGGVLGGFMFAFTLSGFISGYFYNENKLDINTASFIFTLIVFLCATISLFLYSVVATVNAEVRIYYLIFEEGIIPGLYTAMFSLPIVILNPKKGIE